MTLKQSVILSLLKKTFEVSFSVCNLFIYFLSSPLLFPYTFPWVFRYHGSPRLTIQPHHICLPQSQGRTQAHQRGTVGSVDPVLHHNWSAHVIKSAKLQQRIPSIVNLLSKYLYSLNFVKIFGYRHNQHEQVRVLITFGVLEYFKNLRK